jgi:hypothetical protein
MGGNLRWKGELTVGMVARGREVVYLTFVRMSGCECV